MASVALSLSQSSDTSSSSYKTPSYIPPSPASIASSRSASSSKASLDTTDEENVTLTANNVKKFGKKQSLDDLRLLAVSTHITELSLAISDIQTRIFEIQELRHKSNTVGENAGATSVIDQSLMNLDERLESVERGLKTVNETLEPLLQTTAFAAPLNIGDSNANEALLRKHAALLAEWESVQDESEVLREELKEDKWLTVFRTVTDQADGMMSSLEKAVNRCQEFIWQVHRRGVGSTHIQSIQLQSPFTSPYNERLPINMEVCTSLLESFEAKKKHYMPATSKVLSIIDKGVRDRVTKNGETLRRHAESAQRWKTLRERITRTDVEMGNVRKILLSGDAASENGSSTSGTISTKNGYLATPPSGSRSSRAPSSASTLSRSISPFRKFARKLTGTRSKTPVTPLAVKKNKESRTTTSEPPVPTRTLRRQRSSLFPVVQANDPLIPTTPHHKYSQSLTPESSPQPVKLDTDSTSKHKTATIKQKWNSSTKIEPEDRISTIKGTPSRRPPSSVGTYSQSGDLPPIPPITSTYRRSSSRASMASSRPWSPMTSSISTSHSSSHYPLLPIFRPPSRAQTPSRAITPGLATTPRPRPKTPSHIPAPSKNWRSISSSLSEAGWDDEDMRRSLSPAFSTSALSASSSAVNHPPRPPSRSMIPIPSVHLSSPSRPSSSMSLYNRSESPSVAAFRSSALRAQTPESALRARVQQVPFFHGAVGGRPPIRPSLSKLPPSSFKESTGSRAPSRPGSRAGAYTPNTDRLPLHEYIPGNSKDPLDVEVAFIVNSIPHGLLVERVDPPLKKAPREGEEIKAQYSFSNSLSKKIVTCKLTTLTRSGRTGGDTTTKKVMCRVGGGWQDLSHYILNRQAGI